MWRVRTLAILILSTAANITCAELPELLNKPALSRAESALLASSVYQLQLQTLDHAGALAVLKGEGSSTAKLAVAWIKGLDKEASPKERLPFLGAIFNSRVTLDPFSAKMCFGWAARLFPRDYARVSLYTDMQQAGWTITQAEFDRLLASQSQFGGN